jgi:energy-coupling factor transporter ATP-binding protein EcfA2
MSLSGGAKEQLAAAVRLAIAELLALDHDKCLPIVFDDAFAYSDPERVQALQRMLDLAAERGLQVIVLTCNPSDYAGLGAKNVRVDTPSLRQLINANSPPEAISADESHEPLASESMAVTEQDQQDFLDALRACGSKAGNKTMQEKLGWSEQHYDQVKAKLLHLGLVTTGRGRGGTVLIV